MTESGKKLTKYLISAVLIILVLLAYVWQSGGRKSAKEIAKIENGFQPAPHKALYDVKLLSVRGDSRLVDIRGEVYFEWQDACENWSTGHTFKVNYNYEGLPPVNVVTDFDALESKSGEMLYFTLNRQRDGKLSDQIRGSARLSAENQSGLATYTLPEQGTKSLPPNTYFPVEHTQELVRRALAGDTFFNAFLFEGSDMEDPVEVNAFLGPLEELPQNLMANSAIDQSLLSGRAWKLRMAFYTAVDEEQSTPKYEMTAILHDNGVVSDMRIEYDDFAVVQVLKALEKLDPAPCTK